MKLCIEHLGLPAQNPVALCDWYVKSLGARVVCSKNGASPFLLALSEGALIEIYTGEKLLPEAGNNKLNGWRHVALQVPSLEQAQAELEKNGVRFPEGPKPAAGGGRVLFFKDLEGNLLHLVERPAGCQFA